MKRLGLVVGAAVLLLAPGVAEAAPVAAGCRFQLGFAALHDLIPGIVGECRADETHNPEDGDGLQPTTRGLLVWRKSDNWTAFTDGATTWINGPLGLQSRPNAERFPWEADSVSLRTVRVYFSRHPQSDDDFGQVFGRERSVRVSGGRIATAALEALIAGPTVEERAQGYYSELGGMLSGPSSCGGASFTLRVEAGTARLQLCRQATSAGIGQDARVEAAIEATLEQFPTVTRVQTLTREGHCLFDESGLDRCLQG